LLQNVKGRRAFSEREVVLKKQLTRDCTAKTEKEEGKDA
jgi:hypothetical protein